MEAHHFLAEIRGAPDDDGPRFVYADCLSDAHGFSPATLQNAQNLTSLSLCGCDVNAPQFTELMRASCMRSLKDFRLAADDVLAYEPFVRLFFDPAVLPDLETLHLGSPVKLAMRAYDGAVRCPKNLVLDPGGLDPQAIRRLLADTDGLEAIGSSTKLTKLRSLDISEREISTRGVKAFASTRAAKLTRFTIDWAPEIDAATLDALLTQHSLRTLAIRNNRVGRDGFDSAKILKPLLTNRKAETLRSLALEGFALGGDDVSGDKLIAPLTQSPHLKHLRYLELADGMVDDDGARAIVESDGLHDLVHLNLCTNAIEEAGVKAIAASARRFKLLQRVEINDDVEQELFDAIHGIHGTPLIKSAEQIG